MQNLLLLRPFYGLEKTLVITCHECVQQEKNDQIFAYQCLGNMLRKADHLQQECIRHYLETEGCRQIILAGHYNCHVIKKIFNDPDEYSSRTVLQYNLEALLKEHEHRPLPPVLKDKVLIEANVIEQLKLLMSYDFVFKKVETEKLKVIGVVLDYQANTTKEIFRNGIIFNNLIISN